MKNNIISLGISNLSKGLNENSFTSLDITRKYLEAIKIKNRTLNAFINILEESAIWESKKSDKRRRDGKELSPIDGIPIAIKDNIDIKDIITTGGIKAYRNEISKEDSFIVKLLKDAGAVILGKLNMHEAALGATTQNEFYGKCNNPHYIGFTPGGSSGGAGSAVAAGLCAGAIGTDTLGSIRIPASFCGTVGFKPTFGRISNRGIMPLCKMLDHAGPITRSVEDASLLFEIISKFDFADPECKNMKPYIHNSDLYIKSLHGKNIGFIDNNNISELNIDIQLAYNQAILLLGSEGAKINEIDIDNYFSPEKLIPQSMLIIESELYNFHKTKIIENKKEFSDEFIKNINYAKNQDAPKLLKAISNIKSTRVSIRKIFNNFDALVIPSTPTTAFSFKDKTPKNIASFTCLANFGGCPAISIPTDNTSGLNIPKGLPIGMQIITAPENDLLALQIGSVLEKAVKWKPSNANNNFCRF